METDRQNHGPQTPPPGPALLVITGPTAVGKTELCLQMAEKAGAEIVGADSVQIYRGLAIGSAQPTPQERARAPHHLVDCLPPTQEINAADYAARADAAIAAIAGRGKRVIVSGGTGLYIKALLWGLAPAPPVDAELRAELAARWETEGGGALHRELARLDPPAAARLHPNDRQRVLRALEVCLLSGRPFSQRLQEHGFAHPRYRHLYLALQRPRPELMERIEQRTRQMWEQGIVAEVEGLLAAGLPATAKSLDTLGYRQALAQIQGRVSPQEAMAETMQKTKAYAKRQLTWFKGVPGVEWFSPQDPEGVWRRIRAFWAANKSG